MKSFNYQTLQYIFNKEENTGLIDDRKSIFFNGPILGLRSGKYLAYPKSEIYECQPGDMAYPSGWEIALTITNPNNKYDGFVICVKS